MIEKNYKPLLRKIDTLVFDMDGVFTDNTVIIDHQGNRLRSINMKDSFAVQYALEKSYTIAIISRGRSENIKITFRDIGVHDVYLGVMNKLETLKEFLDLYGKQPEQTLYMGDDIPDIECIKYASVGCCPQDACPEVKNVANYISHLSGSKGCVRDIIYQVMKAQGKW